MYPTIDFSAGQKAKWWPGDDSETSGALDRKQALVKKLMGQNRGGGGGKLAAPGQLFGGMPRLGYNPNVRASFQRGEQFNNSNAPQGLQEAIALMSGLGAPPAVSPGTPHGGPQAPPQNAPLGGVGPGAADPGNAPALPPSPPASPPNFSGGNENATSWVLGGPDGVPTHTPPIGGDTSRANIPMAVRAALEGGQMTQGVNAWLQANPWFIAQLGGLGGQ